MTEVSLNAAAEWVVALLQGGGEGETVSLRVCMEFGDSDADIVVIDEAAKEHRYGDALYEVAYLLALRRVVASGEVELVFESDGQRTAWARWLGGDVLETAAREL